MQLSQNNFFDPSTPTMRKRSRRRRTKNGGEKRRRLMIIVATTSLPAVDRPNAPRSCQLKHHTSFHIKNKLWLDVPSSHLLWLLHWCIYWDCETTCSRELIESRRGSETSLRGAFYSTQRSSPYFPRRGPELWLCLTGHLGKSQVR